MCVYEINMLYTLKLHIFYVKYISVKLRMRGVLSSKSKVLDASGTVSVNLSFLLWPIISYFFCVHHDFLLKTGHFNIIML